MTNPVPLSQPCPNPVPGHGAQPCPPVPLSRGDRGQGQPKHPRPTNQASTLSLLFDTARWHLSLIRHGLALLLSPNRVGVPPRRPKRAVDRLSLPRPPWVFRGDRA